MYNFQYRKALLVNLFVDFIVVKFRETLNRAIKF
jgi:hypothetical protein